MGIHARTPAPFLIRDRIGGGEGKGEESEGVSKEGWI